MPALVLVRARMASDWERHRIDAATIERVMTAGAMSILDDLRRALAPYSLPDVRARWIPEMRAVSIEWADQPNSTNPPPK